LDGNLWDVKGEGQMKQIKNKTDFFVGLGIIAFIILIWMQTLELPATVRFLPRIIMVICMLMGVGILVKSFFGKGKEAKKPQSNSTNIMVIEIVLAVFAISMMALVDFIGLYTCLFLTIVAISLAITYVGYGFRWKKVLGTIFYDVAVIIIIYLVFHTFLGLNTPTGVLI
jgi:hypothetical protein